MELNELLTTFENLEHSKVLVFPKKKDLYGFSIIECTLCSDEDGRYYFRLHDHEVHPKIYNTDQLAETIEAIEFQLAFKVPLPIQETPNENQ